MNKIRSWTKNRLFKVIASIIGIVILMGWVSFSYSFDYNQYQHKSFPNFVTFSQFLAAAGSLSAVVIALFLDSIRRYLATTDILIASNKDLDKKYRYEVPKKNIFYDCSIRYYLHLKIKNINPKITVKDCTLYLYPQKEIGKYTLDTPRLFSYSLGTEHITKKNITHQDFIDLAHVDLEFRLDLDHYNVTGIKKYKGYSTLYILGADVNNASIKIELKSYPKTQFSIYADSPSLNKLPSFKVTITTIEYQLENFIEKLESKINAQTCHEYNSLIEFDTEDNKPHILEFYDCIGINIEREN